MRVSCLSNLVPFSGPPRWRGERREGRPRLGQPNHRMQGQAHLRPATTTGTRSVFPQIQISFDFFFKINIDKKYTKLRCDFCWLIGQKILVMPLTAWSELCKKMGSKTKFWTREFFPELSFLDFDGKRQLAWIIFHPVMLPFPRRALRTEGIFSNFSNIPISQSLLRKKI